MMISKEFKIRDTGLNAVTGNSVFTPYQNGDAISILAHTIRYEANTFTTQQDSEVLEDNSTFDWVKNEVTAVGSPRLTISGTISGENPNLVRVLHDLRSKRGMKQISGGIFLLDQIYQDDDGTDKWVNAIITNLTFSEVYANDTANINFTLQLKVV